MNTITVQCSNLLSHKRALIRVILVSYLIILIIEFDIFHTITLESINFEYPRLPSKILKCRRYYELGKLNVQRTWKRDFTHTIVFTRMSKIL